jgi:hypothetical protein
MKKIEFEIITLDWIKVDYDSFPPSSGIYQIYGTSPLYGMETLLYIGQTVNLWQRIKDHMTSEKSFIGRQPNKTCRFATLCPELLNIAEDILIAMHKPCFNSSSLIQVRQEVRDKPFYIQNHGERGMLNIETTNYYFYVPKKEPQELLVH